LSRRSFLAAILCAACSRPAPPGSGEIQVRVPAGLRIARSLDTLVVTLDPATLATTTVVVDAGMFAGIEAVASVRPLRRAPAALRPDRAPVRRAITPGTSFEAAAATWTTTPDGIPVPGARHAVTMELALFETDVPPGPAWDPHSPRYRLLWSRTLEQAEE
jgi:hypothetical protein